MDESNNNAVDGQSDAGKSSRDNNSSMASSNIPTIVINNEAETHLDVAENVFDEEASPPPPPPTIKMNDSYGPSYVDKSLNDGPEIYESRSRSNTNTPLLKIGDEPMERTRSRATTAPGVDLLEMMARLEPMTSSATNEDEDEVVHDAYTFKPPVDRTLRAVREMDDIMPSEEEDLAHRRQRQTGRRGSLPVFLPSSQVSFVGFGFIIAFERNRIDCSVLAMAQLSRIVVGTSTASAVKRLAYGQVEEEALLKEG